MSPSEVWVSIFQRVSSRSQPIRCPFLPQFFLFCLFFKVLTFFMYFFFFLPLFSLFASYAETMEVCPHTNVSMQSWPFWWRFLLLLNVGVYNMLGNVYAAGVPPLFSLLIQEFKITSEEASQLSTYTLLTLGISVSSCPRIHVANSTRWRQL